MRSVLACLLALFLAVLLAGSTAMADSNVLFIFDASGSMKKKADGGTRIDAAKKAMADMLGDMPADVRLGLVLYGHRRAKDCSDIELVSPIGSDGAAAISATISSVKVKGETPIAGALQYAARSFAAFKGQNNTIVLVTDGIEECGGDPCAAAAAIRDAGLDLKVDIVGFTLTAEQRKAVQCIADSTGGTYFDARNAKALRTALAEVKQQLVVPVLPKPVVLNLLNAANGGHLETAIERDWQKIVTVEEPYDSTQYLHYTHDFPAEAVFSFKDRMQARFSRFNIYVPDTRASNVKDFELSAGDDLFGPYRPLGTFTTNNARLADSPYQPFAFPEVTARYLKFRVVSTHGGGTPVDLFPIQVVGTLVDGTAEPQPASGPGAGEVNLVAMANGGKMISASFPEWVGVIAQSDDFVDTQYVAYTHDVPTEAVFAFKDGRPARFDKFAVLIPGAAGSNPREIELRSGDDASGPFRSIGTFTTQDLLVMQSPYQAFSFPAVTAKFLQVRLLSQYNPESPVYLRPIKLFGTLQ